MEIWKSFALATIVWCAPVVVLPAQPEHDLLYWAGMLVSHMNAQNTDYRHKETSVTWAAPYESFTDCSGFINALLQKNYGWDGQYFKRWLGKARPLAYNYYDAIAAENHFTIVRRIGDIQPGDIIAIKYNDRSEHEDNTGHLLLVAKRPERRKATALVDPGTDQFEITIIDSSKSPHGKNDTRHSADGSEYAGLGSGLFRLYADAQGNIKGYSWSTSKPKPGFDPFANEIIVGRIRI